MNTNNKWIYIIGGIIILFLAVNIWISLNNSKSLQTVFLHRDSVIEHKIDSVMQGINDFREVYGNDRLIADKEQKIINNYSIYNQKKNELLKNHIDSIYRWTKRKLGTSAEQY